MSSDPGAGSGERREKKEGGGGEGEKMKPRINHPLVFAPFISEEEKGDFKDDQLNSDPNTTVFPEEEKRKKRGKKGGKKSRHLLYRRRRRFRLRGELQKGSDDVLQFQENATGKKEKRKKKGEKEGEGPTRRRKHHGCLERRGGKKEGKGKGTRC